MTRSRRASTVIARLPDGVAAGGPRRRCSRRPPWRGRACSISAPAPGGIGWPFVAAGDDYVGVDLSLGMLRAFVARCERAPRLVQADGHRLPFATRRSTPSC